MNQKKRIITQSKKLDFGLYFGQKIVKTSQQAKMISTKAIKYKLFSETKGKKNLSLITSGVSKTKKPPF